MMIAGALLLLAGLMMFSTGLIGELVMRIYFRDPESPHLRGQGDSDSAAPRKGRRAQLKLPLFAELARPLPPVFEQVLHSLAQSRMIEHKRSPGRLADHRIQQRDQPAPAIEAGQFQRQRRCLPDLHSRRRIFGQPLPLMRVQRSGFNQQPARNAIAPAPVSPASHPADPPRKAAAKTPDIPPSLHPACAGIRLRFASVRPRFAESRAFRARPFLPNRGR